VRNSSFAKIFLFLILILAPPATASSQSLDVNIRVGTSLNNNRAITCSQGERLLRFRGFRDVRRIDCRGRFFVYRAWMGSRRYEVALNSRNGRVVDVRRIRR
jgi:hypothetical protein